MRPALPCLRELMSLSEDNVGSNCLFSYHAQVAACHNSRTDCAPTEAPSFSIAVFVDTCVADFI